MMLGRWGQFAIHKSPGISWKLLGEVILRAGSGSVSQLLLTPQAAPFLGLSGPKVPQYRRGQRHWEGGI